METESFLEQTIQVIEAFAAKGPRSGITAVSQILFSCFIRASSMLVLSFKALNLVMYHGRSPSR